MIKATVHSYLLNFKQPAGTSRGVLRTKESFFLRIEDPTTPFAVGLGEVGVLRGLSVDDVPELESQLAWTAENIHLGLEVLMRGIVPFQAYNSHWSKPLVIYNTAFTTLRLRLAAVSRGRPSMV